MLTKGIRSGFSCIMAKSQYTDSITGNVLVNIRSIDNKIVNLGSAIPIKPYKNTSISTGAKYSNKGITSSTSNTYFFYDNSIDLNTFTLSWWQNILSDDTVWDGISIQNKTISFCFIARGSNSQTSISIEQHNPSWSGIMYKDNTSIPSNNTWYHYAATYDGSNYKFYRNGVLLVTATYDKVGKLDGFALRILSSAYHSIFDDVVLIKDQVLWTGNFTPPDYLLTGDKKIPRKLQSRMLYYPVRYGDYFDKAFIY